MKLKDKQHYLNSKNRFKCIFLLFFITVLYQSCKKQDLLKTEIGVTQNYYNEKFFTTNRTNDANENTIVNYLKRVNEKENFVNNAIKQIGFPRWDKTTYFAESVSNSAVQNNDSSFTYYIPFVRDSQNFVNASLIIVTNLSDTT